MLLGSKCFSAQMVTPEGPFPLGPFPRHIWIHNNTPQDDLDKACHEIWKRVQRLPEELQPTPLWHLLCSDLSGTLQTDSTNSQSNNYLLDEPEGLECIYKAVIGNREREMKLRALCDARLSAKSVIPSLYSGKSPKPNKGLEDGSVTGAHSTPGSKPETPVLLKRPDTAKGARNQVMAEETKDEEGIIPNGMLSCANSTTAVSSPSQTMGQQQQLPVFAKICSKTNPDAITKSPVTTVMQDKKHIQYTGTTSGFSTATVTTGLNQPVWQSQSFLPLPIFSSHLNFPQFQGPYQRARFPYPQALHPSFGCYSRQVAPYSPQQFFQPPYAPMSNYVTVVQPGYPYQHLSPPALPRNIQDLSPMPSDGIQNPFSHSYWFSSRPGGAVVTNWNYLSSESCVKF